MLNYPTLFFQDLPYFTLEILLFVFTISLFTFNIVMSNSKVFNYPAMLNFTMVSIAFFMFCLSFVAYALLDIKATIYLFDSQFIFNPFTNLIKFIIIISVFFFILLSFTYIKFEKFKNYEFGILILLSICGMFLLLSSNDMITFYLSLELQTLCLYTLACYKRFSNFSTEAALKYFILGGFTSAILLFGFSIIYGFTGMTKFSDLYILLQYLFDDFDNLNNYHYGILLGFLFVTFTLLFKLGAAPFQSWVPDVYEGSPTIITAFFAIIAKLSILCLFFRFANMFFILFAPFWSLILTISGLLSIIIGSLGAIYQLKIKRMLAYSAITHVGFMLLGFSTLSFNGYLAVLLYLIIYIIINFGIFTVIICLRTWNSNVQLKSIYDFRSLYYTRPYLALALCLGLFSLAGIPPLAGFFGKYFIFMALIQNEMYFVAILAILFSVVGAFYYLRIVKILFFHEGKKTKQFYIPLFKTNKLIVSLSFTFNVLFVIFPFILLLFLEEYIYYIV